MFNQLLVMLFYFL